MLLFSALFSAQRLSVHKSFFHPLVVIAAYQTSLSYSAHADCLYTRAFFHCCLLGAKHNILLSTCRVLRGLSLSRHLSSSHCIFSCWASPTLQPVPSCQASSLLLPLVGCLAAGLETSKLLAGLHCNAASNPCKVLFRLCLQFFVVGDAPSSGICTTPCINVPFTCCVLLGTVLPPTLPLKHMDADADACDARKVYRVDSKHAFWHGCRAAAKYPNHGRIVVTQLSIGVGIPMTILLLKASTSINMLSCCNNTSMCTLTHSCHSTKVQCQLSPDAGCLLPIMRKRLL